MIKAMIFDMDGVLLDTERLMCDAWRVCGAARGMQDLEGSIVASMGRNHADTEAYMKKKYGADFDYIQFRQETSAYFYDRVHREGIPVKAGVFELLDFLKARDYRIALASSARKESVLSHMRAIGAEEYFEEIVTGDMVEHSKPHPEIYEIACRGLGVSPEEAVAIEDSPNGIRSAYAAGMRVIMVPDMIQPDKEIQGCLWKLCGSLCEVVDILTQMRSGSGQEE